MSNEMNNLFATENNATVVSGRGLAGTARLTNLANEIAANIINTMNADIDNYVEDIKASQVDNNAMDELIAKVNPLDSVDVEFLKELDEATIDGMLKSQQSKRSRCKNKTMTMDNYRALMVGAISENLIRIATGKEKQHGGRRVSGSVDYTIEQLEQLGEDQERLRKEIRNVQSKKSIMKSKADFDESDERYQALLRAEQQLKDMRVETGRGIVEVDTTKNALTDLLAGKDLSNMKAADSKKLLEEIAALTHVDGDKDIEEGEE